MGFSTVGYSARARPGCRFAPEGCNGIASAGLTGRRLHTSVGPGLCFFEKMEPSRFGSSRRSRERRDTYDAPSTGLA